jgi:diadenosine tetraphosphate (Ap4A) HIT family hydrolase
MDERIVHREHLDLAALALASQFALDHFNYSFLQNQGRHVHMHLIPCYQEYRDFNAIQFTDPYYPHHYSAKI